ncbi:Similar to Chromatin structure-remodeling complex subunit snf21; acc. no. Q9UTN6 [Pyronema omphalodes CBS 100304]|uniref:Similar to Chromatin structure-remodeling complex subunit snf21 acc. no. Q9UTN6 n=1 Tax=Pyronema omphalodes (strain CBS 100304) TaxID=1076935 RepID=U4LRP5_PYROM|nr:Similar to Chromatin structure-remodeling complex subunit snf21; acc. no. Q9UTN6 [Pyronema omphalodes CBS 100304]
MNSLANGGMPQQGGMSAMSREQVSDIYNKWKALKEAGANETNPEFAQLSAILQSFKQRSNAHQQQMQAMQQQQMNRGNQDMSPGAGPQANGRLSQHARQPSHPQGMQQMPGQNFNAPSSPKRAASDASSIANNAAANMAQPTAPTSNSFTPDQLAVLRHQIMAFKYITRNKPVPPNVQQGFLYPLKVGQQINQVAAAKAVLDGVVNKEKSKPEYETFISPWERVPKSIPFLEHAIRDNRPIIPGIMPVGIDVANLQMERERVRLNRIAARKQELEELPSNVAEYDSRNGLDIVNDSLKLKALIEYKALCLLPKQRLLRQDMVNRMVHADSLVVTSNRAVFRRMKKQSLREARITEKLEKQQRDQREAKERRKHTEYIMSVINHGNEIKAAARAKEQKAQKLGRLMLSHHQFMEKEEQKRIERMAKQRLQALKANDEEAYLKLLGQAKDTRITHLLRQTDSFLDSLAASVRQQQRDAIQNYGENEGYYEPDAAEDEGGKIDYFNVAHRIKEEINEQPTILTGGKLKDYQLKGLQWMISLYNNNLNGILADEMGLGKTIQTISLNGPFLVIVPLSTLTNWTLEFEKWAPSVGTIVYKGPPTVRKTQQNHIKHGNWQVLLTTYEYIIKDRPILSKVKWNYMIIDEGHRMKNAQSKLSATLTTYYNCRYRLILTGTPLQNNLPELWALLNFVLPTIFKSVKSFDEWFNTPFANTGGQDKMELTEEEALLVIRRLHKVLRPFLLRRLKKDVEAELPDKVEKVIKCKLSALQSKLYTQMMTNGILYVNNEDKGGKLGVKGLSNMIMQLRKLCNHPFVFEEVESAVNPSKINNDSLWRTAGKFELLDRLLPKFFRTGHKVLIFFQMTQIMNIMEDFLHLRGFRYLRLDGSTKADDRSDLLKQFNAPDSPYFIFLLSTRAGGLGLNLQSADTVIIYDSDWNPHQDLQAQDRAHRIGQKNEVRILRLITSNSVEERILERAQYKLDIDGKVIQAGKFDNKSTNEERDALLRVMLEAEEKEAGDNEELDDDELNEIISRNDSELELFKKMDDERNSDAKYGINGTTPRLFTESELPELYLRENVLPIAEDTGPVGRGARERKVTSYDDGLTEEQWLDAIDNDEDSIEDAVNRKRARIAKREANKARRGYNDSSPPAESPAPEEPPPTVKRKRGRKPNSEKRRAEEEEVQVTLKTNPRKRQRVGKQGFVSSDGLAEQNRVALQAACEVIFNACKDLEEAETGRVRSEIFEKLPSKRMFPDYYQIIKQPISFNEIKKRIKNGDYTNLEGLRDDFKLMFNNARIYNEEGSIEEFDRRYAEEKATYDALVGANGLLDGTSTTGMGSSAGTPAGPDTPHIRLKVGGASTETPDRDRGDEGSYDDSD